jgi:hypothetical protein
MPPRLRTEFVLDLDASDRHTVARAQRWLPLIYRRTPLFLRFVGPYREAEYRLAGRSIDATVRWSNRFWIGQPQLPMDKEYI